MPPKLNNDRVQGVDATLLLERVRFALGDRSGYYVVVGEEKIGPLEADDAYQLWESEMQGEVKYFDGVDMLNPDGTM